MANKASLLDWPSRYQALAKQCQSPQLRQFYQAGIPAGDTPLEHVPFAALDFETTGLDARNDDIVSIGVVPFSWHRIYCQRSGHWLVKPSQQLAESSIVIHGITHSEIANAPDLTAVLEPVLEALAGHVAVVHYHAIERPFFFNALERRIGEGIEFALIDTMDIEHQALLARRGLLGRLFKDKIGSLRLGDTRLRYNLPAYQGHNALTDALATAELLQAQLRYHYRPDTPLSQLWK